MSYNEVTVKEDGGIVRFFSIKTFEVGDTVKEYVAGVLSRHVNGIVIKCEKYR